MSLPEYLLEPDYLVDADYCPDHGDYESENNVCPYCVIDAQEQRIEWELERRMLEEDDR